MAEDKKDHNHTDAGNSESKILNLPVKVDKALSLNGFISYREKHLP